MKVILKPYFQSITGKLAAEYPFSIRKRGADFFVFRDGNSRISPWPGDLWEYMCLLAKIAQLQFVIADIRVPRDEVLKALAEARTDLYVDNITYKAELGAEDVLKLAAHYTPDVARKVCNY